MTVSRNSFILTTIIEMTQSYQLRFKYLPREGHQGTLVVGLFIKSLFSKYV